MYCILLLFNILQVRKCLMREERWVILPYWDYRLDHVMEDPTKSIFWSSLFLGNGQGRVVNGPFANWTTPGEGRYLQRNIGLSRSSLINSISIQNVFRKRYNSEILTPTTRGINTETDYP